MPTRQPWADLPPVRTAEEAFAFLSLVGVATFSRRGRTLVPALWDVLAPREEWDSHPMVWKDLLHESGRVHYGTLILGRPSLVLPELLPAFYRLQGLDADGYLDAYDCGLVPRPAVRVLRALLDEGPLPTRALRRAAGLAGAGEKPAFSAATHTLMRTLTITMLGSRSRTLPGYKYEWDVFERVRPEVSVAAVVREPDPAGAITAIAERCAAWLGEDADAAALFGWTALTRPHADSERLPERTDIRDAQPATL
jgi:hypothetical protein